VLEAPLVLEAKGVAFEYPGPLRALDGIDVRLGRGELAVVIGPNGSGKSTLLKVLAGLLAPSAGSVSLDGRAITEYAPRERASAIAVVPQFLPALPEVRVDDFVATGRYAHVGRFAAIRAADKSIVRRALEQCDAADLAHRSLAELSGGQRQRVLIARAIAQESRILLVDEPTSALDPEHQIRVLDLVAGLVGAERTALLVMHDLNLASQYATRILLLDGGRVVADGDVEHVLVREVLEPVYGTHLYYGRAATSGRPFVLPWSDRAERMKAHES
jgi:iron complex transport system ATP-binding protein